MSSKTSEAEAPVTADSVPPAGRGRRRRWLRLVSVGAAVFVALGAGGWGAAERLQAVHAQPAAPMHGSALAPVRMGAATGVMASPRIGRLAVEGIGRGSWVEVRIDSARGRILYAGVVSSGNSVDLKGRRLWGALRRRRKPRHQGERRPRSAERNGGRPRHRARADEAVNKPNRSRSRTRSARLRLEGMAGLELHDQVKLPFAEPGLDASHDPGPPADHHLLAHLE